MRTSKALLAVAIVAGCSAAGVAAGLLLTGGPAGAASGRPPPLTIGALFSLTGTGGSYGPEQLRGARLAVAEINAAGGVGGAPLRLAAMDDRSDPEHGRTAMRTLIEKNGALAVLGPTLSLVALRADPLADRLQTPVLAVSNTIDGIVGRCPYPCSWIWRNSLGESAAVPANVEQYVLAHHPSSAALIHAAGDPLGEAEVKFAARSFRSENVRVLGGFSIARTGSSRAVVAKALARKPDVLFIGTASGPQGVELIREARAAGFSGAILGGNSFNSTTVAKLAGRPGRGAQSGAAWYAGNSFPANAQFVTAYRQAYSAEPDQFAAQAYTGVQILVSALRKAGLAGSTAPVAQQRVEVQNALADTALMTPLGPFRFTAAHDVEQIVWVQAIDGRGSHVLVGFCNPDCGAER